jgi:hypothetical protein
MSQIKGEFQRKKRLENILHANKKFKTTSIAVPIVQEQAEQQEDELDDLFYVSDGDEDSEHDIGSSREWKKLINEWIEMVQDEEEGMNQMDEENNEDLEPLVMDLDQILRKQHPLINKKAKWKLGDIFNFEKLRPPAYLSLLSKLLLTKFSFFFIKILNY